MKIAVSSDEYAPLVELILAELKKRGHAARYFGPGAGEEADWPEVTRQAADLVASGVAEQGIVMCWTGTGASIAANKLRGIRAALCRDAETAKGARTWNHANVLALSIRATPLPVAKEILDAWFSTPLSEDDWNLKQIERIRNLESEKGER